MAATDNNITSSEDIMRLAFEASPDGMIVIDRKGKIVFVNSSIEALFGYQREELLGQEVEILVPERFRRQHPQLRNHYLEAPQTRAMGSGRELYGRHRDGREFPVEIGLNSIDGVNTPLVLAVIIDITERLRAQEMMRLAVEAAPNGMIISDGEGRITMVNSLTENMFGYSREELIGQEVSILVPRRFQQHHPRLRRKYYQHPESRAMGKGRDLYALHKDGFEFPVEIGLNPIETAQGIVILASVVDITERKQHEERLKSALHEKEVLLSEIHHRVKNNLQIIDSLIGMQTLNITHEEPMSVLIESQNRIRTMSIIHQMLYQSQDFSRTETAAAVSSLVNNLATSYGIDGNRIRLEIDIDDVPLPIDTSIPLGLIINELVSNAMKHAFPESRSGSINISLKPIPDGNLLLAVTDTGVGIPDDVDLDMSDSLGLRLVAALTDQLDGEMSVQRRQPTRFDLCFPLQNEIV